MTEIFDRVLPPKSKNVLQYLRKLPLSSFYLAGGTGLALQIGHRISIDFDFFSDSDPLDAANRLEILSALTKAGAKFNIETDKDRTLQLAIEGVRVSFFNYPYPMLDGLVQLECFKTASLKDIGAMKLSALINRGARRDFVDLFEIVNRISLSELLECAGKKYSQTTDFPLQALKSLLYFDDAEPEPMPELLVPISWSEIRSFFEREVPLLTHRLL